MYKPANIREFITPAKHKKAVVYEANGRVKKSYEVVGTIRGKFKQKGSTEKLANGLTAVVTTTTFITWFKSDLKASDILTIGGVDYEIIGEVENVEMRGRYAVINLEKVSGGA